jgi:hypothetical protein
MEFNFSSKPNRRFLVRGGLSATIVLLSDFAAKYLIGQGLVDGPLVWALALIPGLAMVGIFYAYGMLIIEQKDEFIRMLVLRQLLIGTGIALSFATVWGFLEKFGLIEPIDPFYFVLAWLFGVAFGSVVNRITHGAWGEMS